MLQPFSVNIHSRKFYNHVPFNQGRIHLYTNSYRYPIDVKRHPLPICPLIKSKWLSDLRHDDNMSPIWVNAALSLICDAKTKTTATNICRRHASRHSQVEVIHQVNRCFNKDATKWKMWMNHMYVAHIAIANAD